MRDLRSEIQLNFFYGGMEHVGSRHKQVGREDAKVLHGGLPFVGDGIPLLDAFDFVAPKKDAVEYVAVGREHVYGVALDPKVAALEFPFSPAVESLH